MEMMFSTCMIIAKIVDIETADNRYKGANWEPNIDAAANR